MSLFRRSLMSASKDALKSNFSIVIETKVATKGALKINKTVDYSGNEYNNIYTVDWGDGTIENVNNTNVMHTYAIVGTYTIKLDGQVEGITFGTNEDLGFKTLLKQIISFGTTLKTMNFMFRNIGNSGTITIPKCLSLNVAYMNGAFANGGTWEISQGAFALLTKCDFNCPFEKIVTGSKDDTTSSEGCSIYLNETIFPNTTELPKMNLNAFFRNCTIMTPIPEYFLSHIESPVILDQMFNGAGCAYDLPEQWLPQDIDSMLDFMGDYTGNFGTGGTDIYDANFVGDMEEVWNRVPPPPHNSNSLKCTTLANYADIPAEWGGAEEE